VEGDWGIRLDKGNITIEVRDKKDRNFGTVSIGQAGVRVRGQARRKPTEVRWDDLNRSEPPASGVEPRAVEARRGGPHHALDEGDARSIA